MKKQKLYDAITSISDKTVADAKKYKFRRYRPLWISAVACLLVAAICVPMIFGRDAVDADGQKQAADPVTELFSGFRVVASAATPDTRYKDISGVPDGVGEFVKNSNAHLFSGTDQNVLYSPMGAYFSLAMLAECTDGNSRQQILKALGADSLEGNRKQANALLQNISNSVSLPPAASLWIPDNRTYKQNTLDNLSYKYFASVFEGKYSDAETLEGMKKWMNENTGDEISELVADFELMENSDMLLLNTLCYQSEWKNAFAKEYTNQQCFFGRGGNVNADFMQLTDDFRYRECDGFSVLALECKDGGRMMFMLPDYGNHIETMLKSDECAEAFVDMDFCDSTYKVAVTLPKFDISQTTDLRQTAMALGITDVFDDSKADFSALSDDMDCDLIGRFSQMIGVSIDEDGAKAASVTVAEGTYKSDDGPKTEIKSFYANRPFAFVMFSKYGSPLFSGVINNPVA